MRVLLVRPNSKWKHTYIPIGLGYLAEAVRKAGHEVSILDARFERLSPEEVVKYVREARPDVVGLSAVHVTVEINGTIQLAKALRSSGIDTNIVLGGPLVSTSGEYFVNEALVDAAIIGEGEISFPKYLEFLEGKLPLSEVPGLIYKQNGEIVSNPRGEFVANVDDLNLAWDLIRPERYFSNSGLSNFHITKKSMRCVPIFTSRGCPFGCIYCHNMFGRKFRARSAENVLDEIVMLKEEYNIGELEVVDDCFNLDLVRAKAIAQGIIDRKIGIALSFPNGLRADRMDEELIDLLKEAGAFRIFYAVETASPRLQKLIHKNVNLKRTQEIIAYTAGKGIMTCGFFMLGFPTETEEEMRLTTEYAIHSKLHQAYFFYVLPFPGTVLADEYCQFNWKEQGVVNLAFFGLTHNLSAVPNDLLYKICKRAYFRFHFSPIRIWRTAKVIPKNLATFRAALYLAGLGIHDKDKGEDQEMF